MNRKALVVIDMQNDITRHYRDIMDRLIAAVGWAAESGMEIVYIAQQPVRRYAHFKAGYKRGRTRAGAKGCLGSYFC